MNKLYRNDDPGVLKVIFFASLIITLSIAFTGTIVYMIARNEVVHKLKTIDLIRYAESIADKIDGRIERAMETSLILAKDPAVIQWVSDREMDEQLGRYAIQKMTGLAREFDYENSFIVSALTNHYWAESGSIIDTMDANDQYDDWFFQTVSSREPVSVAYDYNAKRKDTYVFINALMGDVNEPIAVVGVGLSLKGLSQAIENYKLGIDNDIWLIDGQGNVYLSDTYNQNGKNIEDFIPQEIKLRITEHIANAKANIQVTEYKNDKGQIIDVVSYPLKSTDWNLLFQMKRSDAVSVLDSIKWNALLATLISLIAIIFIFYFVSRKLADPFKRALQLNQTLENKVNERTKELTDKNLMLTDSIEYAKRIQESILPSADQIVFHDYFLIWKPKEVVGGDFYWIKRLDRGYLVAIGDCTGHGVPGAFMSMLSISLLNHITDHENKEDPALILNRLNAELKQTLNQSTDKGDFHDGLDIGLCLVNGNQMTFAGAKCSLYIKNDHELRVINGNKRCIGDRRIDETYPYSNTVIDIQKNDLFYMTTDGFLDQNGGDKGYSFGRKQFMKLIDRLHGKPLSEQRIDFLNELEAFMGDESQRDDITVIAFRVKKSLDQDNL